MGLIALPSMLSSATRRILRSVASRQVVTWDTDSAERADDRPDLASRLSIGQMFIAGIRPGLLLSALFVAYILIRSYIQKDWTSVPPEERLPRRERVKLLGRCYFHGLISRVMGSMFFGLATPSEASAIGALGAIVSALVKRTFPGEASPRRCSSPCA